MYKSALPLDVYSKKGLAQRLKAEGENSPADVILTVDIGRLYVYDDLDLLAPIDSKKLKNNIPNYLRSPDNTWFGLSKRARVIVVHNEKIAEGEITRIEDLANPKWKGKICSRPGSHVYNRGIMASVLAALGEEEAEKWAKAMVANFAKRPQGNDRAQVKAIHEGECEIALINNYYFGKLKFSEDPEQRKWADSVRLVFPNQAEGDRGAHVNISGGGIAKFSKNKEEAQKLLEFLTSEKAQSATRFKKIRDIKTIISAGTVIHNAKILAEELVTLSFGTRNLKYPRSCLILKSINSL